MNTVVTGYLAMEGMLMSLHAWNSVPTYLLHIGTDISMSLFVTRREFSFLVDFSTEQHQVLTSSPSKVSNFAADQTNLLHNMWQIGRQGIDPCTQVLAQEMH